MSEKLCLQWNDFQANANSAFGKLRSDNEFSDVTLACEDGQQFEAHKVILISASPFFHNLLRRNKHTRPLIFMKGIKSDDMHAILDFLYCGEANVFQENLDTFLALAEELKLKGLMGQPDAQEDKVTNASPQVNQRRIKAKRKELNLLKDSNTLRTEQQLVMADIGAEQKVTISEHSSGDLEELDALVKSMMEQGQNMVANGNQQKMTKICRVCGKEGLATTIKDHIEAHHLEGVSLPCGNCGKIFRSRVSLRQHKCNNILSA